MTQHVEESTTTTVQPPSDDPASDPSTRSAADDTTTTDTGPDAADATDSTGGPEVVAPDTVEVQAGTVTPTPGAVSTPQARPDVPDDLRQSLATYLKKLAEQICAEQPNVPKPKELVDLDSFSAIQVVLEAENHIGVPVLEDLGDFAGNTYDELSRYLLQAVAMKGELKTVAESL